MEKLRQLLDKTLGGQFLRMTISNPRKKNGISKIKIHPVLIKGELFYQEETYRNAQTFHKNIAYEEKNVLIQRISDAMADLKQIEWETQEKTYQAFVNRQMKASVKVKKKAKCAHAEENGMQQFSHNRQKQYLLEEGKPVDFLVELGVMTAEGIVVKRLYDKFRQINRFLEFMDDVQDVLSKDRELTIIDFGCGKSYLTFAIYYYFQKLKKRSVRIIGLDLKQDVILHCNALAKKLQYDKLEFLHGDIAQYNGVNRADMVVTLHACDTATDYALAKAVEWDAKVILSVPCCQHELNRQMQSEVLKPLFRYGLIKERVAALFTDAMRAQLLEQHGYQVQVMEFIDMEHTPKNILLRGVKKHGKKHSREDYEACRDFLHADLTLEKLLG